MRYWLVICYVGHCGRRKAPREIGLAIEAKDSVEALLQAKKFPGVKHHGSHYMRYTRNLTRRIYRTTKNQCL